MYRLNGLYIIYKESINYRWLTLIAFKSVIYNELRWESFMVVELSFTYSLKNVYVGLALVFFGRTAIFISFVAANRSMKNAELFHFKQFALYSGCLNQIKLPTIDINYFTILDI